MVTVSEWLQKSLLTLNTKKTMYLCFHKTAASAPDPSFQIQVSNTMLFRSKTLKYLGVQIDENLNFRAHIGALSTKLRKLINVMRNLRYAACPETLKTVYFALCQSIIVYCISCWGSAAKTYLIQAERAQRSVLKVMLRKPYRYSTSNLYTEARVLSIRKLYILKASLLVHKSVICSLEYDSLLNLRVYRIKNPSVRTTFCQRLGNFIKTHIYNKVVRLCDIKDKSVTEAKFYINKWLFSLTYEEVEQLLTV